MTDAITPELGTHEAGIQQAEDRVAQIKDRHAAREAELSRLRAEVDSRDALLRFLEPIINKASDRRLMNPTQQDTDDAIRGLVRLHAMVPGPYSPPTAEPAAWLSPGGTKLYRSYEDYRDGE